MIIELSNTDWSKNNYKSIEKCNIIVYLYDCQIENSSIEKS